MQWNIVQLVSYYDFVYIITIVKVRYTHAEGAFEVMVNVKRLRIVPLAEELGNYVSMHLKFVV